MCWKRKKPESITGNKVALLFGINDYMGSNNDLSGCLNDVDDVEKKLKNEFPEFQIRKFKDSEVTTQKFISEIENAFASYAKYIYVHYSGHGTTNNVNQALYLYNGPLWDKALCDLEDSTPEDKKVTVKFDSCFSGGMDDRSFNLLSRRNKNRFYPMAGIRSISGTEKKFLERDVHKWVIYAGCGPRQTAADAWFNGRANGAFTYADNKSYNPLTINAKAIISCIDFLFHKNFEQIPELVGPGDRINGLVLQ